MLFRSSALQKKAGSVENAIHGRKDAGTALSALEKALAELIGALRESLPPAAPLAALDPAQVAATMEKLHALLAANDPEAEELAESSLAVLHATLDDKADRFIRLVRNYDFDQALEMLVAASKPVAAG